MHYLITQPGKPIPVYDGSRPFCAVVAAEIVVDSGWRRRLCAWLVDLGCVYALTHGPECAEWHDAIDDAILAKHDFTSVPANEHVMTTWHDDEPLSEVLWFAKHSALHPVHELQDLMVLHVSEHEQEESIRELYAAAEQLDAADHQA